MLDALKFINSARRSCIKIYNLQETLQKILHPLAFIRNKPSLLFAMKARTKVIIAINSGKVHLNKLSILLHISPL